MNLTFRTFIAVSLSIGAHPLLATGRHEPQKTTPPAADAAASNPGLAKVRTQILQAAEHRDFAMLTPVLDENVTIDSRGSLTPPEFLVHVQIWPEDFGVTFWRDIRDAVQSGIVDDGLVVFAPYAWRRASMRVQFGQSIEGQWKVIAIVRDLPPRTRLLPVDVVSSDPGLTSVRAQILQAVKRRDFRMLLPVLGPQFKLWDDDEHSSTARKFVALAQTWAKEDVAHFWRNLWDAMAVGMAPVQNQDLLTDYVYVKLVDSQIDLAAATSETLAITGDRVALHSAPPADAPAIELLSYDIVTTEENESDERPLRFDGYLYGWRQVTAPSGKTGWVSKKYTRSAGDEAVWFSKIDGEWKLVAIGKQD